MITYRVRYDCGHEATIAHEGGSGTGGYVCAPLPCRACKPPYTVKVRGLWDRKRRDTGMTESEHNGWTLLP